MRGFVQSIDTRWRGLLHRLLWSLKRVEHRLSQTWQLLNGMQRQLRSLAALQRELGLECPGVTAVWAQLRNCLSMRSEMAHFCTNLQACIVLSTPGCSQRRAHPNK